MIHSEQLDKIGPALAKAQAEMGGAVKEATNPFFNKKYADLTSVWKAAKEPLHNNGLSVIQSPLSEDGRIGVRTMILHTSGQFLMGSYTIGVKKQNDPQADGISITYARRYALAAFVGICPVDDDAEGVMDRSTKNTPQQTTKPLPALPKDTGNSERNYQALMDSLLLIDTNKQMDAFVNVNKDKFGKLMDEETMGFFKAEVTKRRKEIK